MADPTTAPANGATTGLPSGAAKFDKFESDAEKVASAGKATTSALNDAAHSLLDAAKTLLEGKTEIVVAKGQKVYGKVKEQAVERFGDTDVLVREKPYLALGIAAAAGFLLGHLISSGRSQVVYLRDAR